MLNRLNILKRIVKEATNIIAWQEAINTDLHNIDAAWIVSGTIAWARLAANFPRTIAQLLSDHNLANHPLVIIPVMDWAHISGLFPRTIVDLLSDHNLANHPLAIIPVMDWAHISGLFPRTIAALLSNHNLANHPLAIIPTMDDGHIPDLETLSYGGAFAVAQIPGLPASQITSGQFPLNRMPRAASGFLRGKGVGVNPAYEALVAGDIPNLDAAKITTGTFPVARGGTGLSTIALGGILYASALDVLSRLAPTAANQVLRSTAANALQFATLLAADIPNLAASKITSGQFPLSRMPRAASGQFLEGNGVAADPIFNALIAANIPNLDASKITSGAFILARIPNMDWAHISGLFPRTIADLLSNHNLANHSLAIIPVMDWAHISALFPRTIADLLSDHDKAAHDALNIDADTVDGKQPGTAIGDIAYYNALRRVYDSDRLDGYHETSFGRLAAARTWTATQTFSAATPIKTNKITERTAAAGVDIDNCLIKDGKAEDSNKLEGSTKVQVQDHTPKAHTAASHSDITSSGANIDDAVAKKHDRSHDHSLAGDGTPIAVAGVPNLAASKITSGQFPLARLPRAASGQFLEGNGVGADPIFNALIAANIPSLDAAKITTGIFPVARGGTGLSSIALGGILYASALNVLSRLAPTAANQVLRSTAANALQFAALLAADIPNLDAAKITSGQFNEARIPVLTDAKYPNALLRDGSRLIAGTLNPAIDATYNLGSALRFNYIYGRYASFSFMLCQIAIGDWFPNNDNAQSLGRDGARWSDIWAVNTHWGDLGFTEKTCPKCEELFEVGDEIILKVIRFDERDGGIMTIPMHFACAHKPAKTIKRNVPQFTTEYSFVEGEVVEVRVPIKQKRTITNGEIKNGYDFDKKTGTFFKNKGIKEGYNQNPDGKYIKKGEVGDGYSYDPDVEEYTNSITGEIVEEIEACITVPEEEAVIPERSVSLEEATEDKEVEEVTYKEVEIAI